MLQTKEKLVQLSAEQIEALQYENYKSLNQDTVADLMQSIKETGVRLPISVIKHSKDLKVVDGHHRVEAVRRLMKDYPHITLSLNAVVSDAGDVSAAGNAVHKVVANFTRRENVIDRASGYYLLKEAGKNVKQIADIVGKERTNVEAHLHFYEMYKSNQAVIDQHIEKLKDSFLYKLALKYNRDQSIDINEAIEKELAPKTKIKEQKVDAETVLVQEGYSKKEAKKICTILRDGGLKI